MIRAAGIGLVAVLLLGSSPARAQVSADEQARIHFQAGTNYYNIADYEAALREYSRAYELAGRPALLHNIYLCHERLGNLAEAIDFLERYLTSGAEVPRRHTLEQRLANMRRRLNSQQEPEPTPAEEAPPPITEEEAAPAPIDTPEAEPAATAEGPPDVGVPAPEPASSGPSTPAIVSLAVGGVGLVAFAVVGTLALVEDGSLSDRCADGCDEDELDSLRTLMLVADVSLAVGVVAGALGLVLWLTGSDDGGEETELTGLSPWIGPDGGGLQWRGHL